MQISVESHDYVLGRIASSQTTVLPRSRNIVLVLGDIPVGIVGRAYYR